MAFYIDDEEGSTTQDLWHCLWWGITADVMAIEYYEYLWYDNELDKYRYAVSATSWYSFVDCMQ